MMKKKQKVKNSNLSSAREVRAFIHEIAQRKKSEDAMRKAHKDLEKYAEELKISKETNHQYLDIAGVMLLVIGKDGKVKLINKKGCEILGYKEEDIIGKNWFTHFLPKRIRKEVRQVFHEMMLGALALHEKSENYVLRKDGMERLIRWTNSVMHDENGSPIATLSSGEDITEQKALESRIMEAMVTGQEAERQRLAKDLHDGLGVILSSVKANLGALGPGIDKVGRDRKIYFNRSLSLLDDAILEVRAIGHDLSPRVLEGHGLAEALKTLCDNLDQTHRFSVKFYSSLKKRFNKSFEKTLYRIAQELLNNAIKYSKADSIIVQLNRHGNMLILSVEDNGIGFDKRYMYEHNGRGFRNISGRLKHLNGVFHVESAIGDGTMATVEVPLESAL